MTLWKNYAALLTENIRAEKQKLNLDPNLNLEGMPLNDPKYNMLNNLLEKEQNVSQFQECFQGKESFEDKKNRFIYLYQNNPDIIQKIIAHYMFI